nr:hypothetical protein CFP56_47151 [Quercus suber]
MDLSTAVLLPSSDTGCKLQQRIHSTAFCLMTIGVSASSTPPSHCLRLAAISCESFVGMYFYHCKSFVGMYFYHCKSFVGASFSLTSSLPLFHNYRCVALFMYPSSPPRTCWHWSIERATYQIQAPIVISLKQYCSEISASSLNYAPLLSASCGFEHRWFHLGLCAAAFLLEFVLLSTSSRDNQGSRTKAVPRMFRYSGEGTAKHYDEVMARKLFRVVSSFKFHRLGLFKGYQEILMDDDKLPGSYADYFISQCSSYLASRRGSICIVEPYSLHCFGRQFGFNQHIPGELNEDFRTVTLEQVIKLKIKQLNEVVEPVKRRSDGKPSFGISKAIDKSLGEVCVDKVHSPKRGPSCIVSTPQDVERDNPSKNLDHEGVTQATDRGVDMDSLPDPSGGNAQDDNYPSKRAEEKCTPIATSPSTSEFSIQGPTAFDLATKEIDPSHLGKTNATLSSNPIHKPLRDMTRNKSIMCSLSILATSTVTNFEPDDLISKVDRQRAKMLGGDLLEKVIKTPFTLVTSFRDGVEKIL